MNSSTGDRAVESALAAHRGALDGSESTCVIVPDATRPLPVEIVLRPLLRRLVEQGASVTVLVGLGLHRRMNDRELQPLRRAIGSLDVALRQHEPSEVVELAASAELPVALHRCVVEAQRVICVGTVEPHQYAGYSGGVKAISIGCAGADTISAMHGLTFLRDRRTALGRVAGNPFQTTLWEIAEPIDNVLGLQVVPARDGGILDVYFGDIRHAFDCAHRRASKVFFELYDTPLDWLYLPVPASKASNFYQASRAATYVALVDRPAIRPGGVIVVEAECEEGMGQGRGEKACAAAMRRGKKALLEELNSHRCPPTRGGQQRAYVVAKACDRNQICLVGAPPIPALEPMGIEQFDSVEDIFETVTLHSPSGRRIDDVFHRIPRRSR